MNETKDPTINAIMKKVVSVVSVKAYEGAYAPFYSNKD
jgi:hypothetical protein